jgi:hypothetical protein
MQLTRHPKIGIWKNIPMDSHKLHTAIDGLVNSAKTQDHNLIVQKIKELVPEYIGGNNNNTQSSKNQLSA